VPRFERGFVFQVISLIYLVSVSIAAIYLVAMTSKKDGYATPPVDTYMSAN
jgi:hypothetical protein